MARVYLRLRCGFVIFIYFTIYLFRFYNINIGIIHPIDCLSRPLSYHKASESSRLPNRVDALFLVSPVMHSFVYHEISTSQKKSS